MPDKTRWPCKSHRPHSRRGFAFWPAESYLRSNLIVRGPNQPLAGRLTNAAQSSSRWGNRIGGLADIGYCADMANDPKRAGETTINVVDALRGQQEQLKRLIAQKIWISNASKPTLAEIGAQLTELHRLIAQLESAIWAQMKDAP
jgi:hypothetical protein